MYSNTIINFKESAWNLNIQYTQYFWLTLTHDKRNKGKLSFIIVQLQKPEIKFTNSIFELDQMYKRS